MGKLKQICVGFLKSSPRLFDLAKKTSRFAGDRGYIYNTIEAFSRAKATIRFVQIGSNDGLRNDPIREFIVTNKSWSGYFIEPIPYVFNRLIRNYDYLGRDNLYFLNVAVGSSSGTLDLYTIDDRFLKDLPYYADQVTSFSKEHLVKHFPDVPDINLKIKKNSIKALSPSDLVKEVGGNIDLLHIDIEGYEESVFDAFPFDAVKPSIIIYEDVHLADVVKDKLIAKLNGLGYFTKSVAGDTVAVHQ